MIIIDKPIMLIILIIKMVNKTNNRTKKESMIIINKLYVINKWNIE
jgi:hypothetical protein